MGNLWDASFEVIARRRTEGPNGRVKGCGLRDDVGDLTGLKTPDGDDGGVARGNFTADEGLEGGHEVCPGDNGVNAKMGPRRVDAFSVQGDRETVRSSGGWSGGREEVPGGQVVRDV